jgi:serine/threonine protein kinase
VIEVLNLSDNKKYAAKQISITSFQKNLFEVLTTLNHPNLVKFYSYEVNNNNAYYLMELLNENSLYNYIAKSKLELPAITFYTAQVMQALDHLH